MKEIGAFFVFGFEGLESPSHLLTSIAKKWDVGGVCLFARNIDSPDQVKRLNEQVQKIREDHSLIIAVDQEGGNFQRLKPPAFGTYPPAAKVNVESAEEIGIRMGRELASLGFTIDYAPILDVNSNPDNPIIGVRSFGNNPQDVIEIGRRFIHGLQSTGVLACGKHFPGHGDTSQDSHLTLPTVKHHEKRLRDVEIAPFANLVQDDLTVIMTAHVMYPALDPQKPATFSRIILHDLLRQDLDYRGLITTDDLGMVGSTSHADLPDACIEAFTAGCDLLLVCEFHDRHLEILERFHEAVGKSKALQARAEESFRRLRSMRA